MNGSVGWSDVGILIPYRYWKIFGDDCLIKEYYDQMVRYARFMEKRCGKKPGLMAEISDELGHGSDADEFRSYSDGCKKAYQELVSDGKYSLDTDRQAQLVRPLALGLLNESQKEFAKKRLIKALENYGWRLGTGFLSTPLILNVLAEYDLDAAYKLLENEEIPGWLSMPKNGATTIWKNRLKPESIATKIYNLLRIVVHHMVYHYFCSNTLYMRRRDYEEKSIGIDHGMRTCPCRMRGRSSNCAACSRAD